MNRYLRCRRNVTSVSVACPRYVRETMFTATHGRRADVDGVLIVITDGGSDDPRATINEARKTRDAGIDVLAMGIGDSVRLYELEGMASHPKTRNVFKADGYQFLFQATDMMRSTLCDGRWRWRACRGVGFSTSVLFVLPSAVL